MPNLKNDGGEVKLHLGSGERYLPGYCHIDLDDYPHINYHQDIHDLPMFKSDSVDEVYCSHVLEYFDRFEAEYALREWHRVLKPSGILRIAVPDFEGIVKVYQKYKDVDHKGILGPLYGKRPLGSGLIYHHTVYDFNSLKRLLEKTGFKNVHRYDVVQLFKTFPEGYDDQSFAFIPHKDPKGILVSLNVEAEK